MLTINYNCATEFHIDLNDNGLYTVVFVGEWEGKYLIFSHLDLRLKLIKGHLL
jgi:hypothetical protein